MKRLLTIMVAVVIILGAMVAPAYADAPTMEYWTLAPDCGNGASMGVNVNTTNLQADIFWVRNTSIDDRRLIVEQNNKVLLNEIIPSETDYIEFEVKNFKFMRDPLENNVQYQPNSRVTFDYPY